MSKVHRQRGTDAIFGNEGINEVREKYKWSLRLGGIKEKAGDTILVCSPMIVP